MQALALNKKQSMIPMPSKRTSAALSQSKATAATEHATGKTVPYVSLCLYGSPCGARGRCRISAPRFLAECRKRRLNQGSFVSAVCLVVYFL